MSTSAGVRNDDALRPRLRYDQNMWRVVAPKFEDDFQTILFHHVGAGGSDLKAYNSLKYDSLVGYANDVVEIGRELGLNGATGDRRSPALPDTPTMAEAGIKYYNLTGYFGILFPAGVPIDRVERIYRETIRALETPEVRKLIEENGLFVVGSSPDEFAAYIKQDFDYQKKLMDEVGLRPN